MFMRKTLKNINTLVRDILHDAGFPLVRKQVESRELHVLTAKITDDVLKNLNGCTEILELRTTVGNADDNEDKILPFVTIGYTIITIHEGKFHQVKRMFFAVGREVLELKRTSFGQLTLDEEDLPIGHINKLKCESFY